MRDLVMVEWVDSFSVDPWQTSNDAIENSKKPLICRSVGVLLDDKGEYVTLCHTLNDEGMVCGVLHIPKRCIVTQTKLNG